MSRIRNKNSTRQARTESFLHLRVPGFLPLTPPVTSPCEENQTNEHRVEYLNSLKTGRQVRQQWIESLFELVFPMSPKRHAFSLEKQMEIHFKGHEEEKTHLLKWHGLFLLQ